MKSIALLQKEKQSCDQRALGVKHLRPEAERATGDGRKQLKPRGKLSPQGRQVRGDSAVTLAVGEEYSRAAASLFFPQPITGTCCLLKLV